MSMQDLFQNPPIEAPESAMLPGMGVPTPISAVVEPRAYTGGFPNLWDSSVPGPPTQPGPQRPVSWVYDFDPATGESRATFEGIVIFGGTGNPGVLTFNGRSGTVTLSTADITGAGGATAANATLTGAATLNGSPIQTAASVAAAYVPLAGNATVTGPLTIQSNATAQMTLANPISGTGQLEIVGTPNVFFNSTGIGPSAGTIPAFNINTTALSIPGHVSAGTYYAGPGGWEILEMGAGAGWALRDGTGTTVYGFDQGASNTWLWMYNSVPVANCSLAGAFQAASFTPTSDERTKTDIEELGECLSLVRQLVPKTFKRIGEDHTSWGFTAQQVREVIPAAVVETALGEDRDAPLLALDPMALLAALTNAVRQLDARLSALEGAR